MTSKMPASGRASKLPGSNLSLMGIWWFFVIRARGAVKILSNIRTGAGWFHEHEERKSPNTLGRPG
jgi:hypothetical protein